MDLKRPSTVAAAALVCLAATDAPSSETASLISDFVGHYKSDDFTEAARLFHCPPSFTTTEVDADRHAIAASLRIMSELYGPVRTVSESSGSIYVAPTSACGTAEYWKAHAASITRILDTEQREGEHGYMVFQFSSVGGKPVLFQFGHGLPATHPEARSRAESFLQRKLTQ